MPLVCLFTTHKLSKDRRASSPRHSHTLPPSFLPAGTLEASRAGAGCGGAVVVVSPDDAARDPCAGVARLEALGVAAVAHVVGAGVHDDGAA